MQARQISKPLLTLALSGACGAALAQTSAITVYGIVDASVRRASNVASNGGSVLTMEDGMFTGSRLGFRGSEDLGGGLRAVFTMESGFDPSTGASAQGTTTADYGQEAASPRFWGREIHLALRGGWGGVTLGRQYTVAHQLAARFQALGNANNTALSVFSSHHIARQDNVLRLDTKLGDVELQASRTFGEQVSGEANGSYALGVGYSQGGLSLGAYVQQMENRAGTETRKIIGLGGNYRVSSAVTLFAGHMRRSAEVSVQKNKVWTLGANWRLSPTTVLSAQYFDDQQSGSSALKGARKVGWLSANYEFSKRTDLYLVLDRNRVSDGYSKPSFMGTLGAQNAITAGLRHRF